MLYNWFFGFNWFSRFNELTFSNWLQLVTEILGYRLNYNQSNLCSRKQLQFFGYWRTKLGESRAWSGPWMNCMSPMSRRAHRGQPVIGNDRPTPSAKIIILQTWFPMTPRLHFLPYASICYWRIKYGQELKEMLILPPLVSLNINERSGGRRGLTP